MPICQSCGGPCPSLSRYCGCCRARIEAAEAEKEYWLKKRIEDGKREKEEIDRLEQLRIDKRNQRNELHSAELRLEELTRKIRNQEEEYAEKIEQKPDPVLEYLNNKYNKRLKKYNLP